MGFISSYFSQGMGFLIFMQDRNNLEQLLLSPEAANREIALGICETLFPNEDFSWYKLRHFLANCGFIFQKDWIEQLENLEVWGLSNNQLTTLPKEIGQLGNLQWLYLHGNQLTTLPTEIGQLGNLQSLYLQKNQLTSKARTDIKAMLPNCKIHF